MRLLKKAAAMAMVTCMAGSLAACGGGSKTAATTAAATTAAETKAPETKAEETKAAETTAAEAAKATAGDNKDVKVGISIYKFDDNFMTLYRQELVRYMVEDLGFTESNITVQDGKGDQAEQTNQIQNFITSGVDVMILNLVQASSAPQVTDMCNEAGIPVVYINREPDAAEEGRWGDIKATYVGADAKQSGTYQGEEIVETDNIRLTDTLTVTVHREPDTVRYDSYFIQNKVRRPVTGIKTNLLYWATLTPNLGIDFYIGKKFSLGIEGTYSDWTLFGNNVDRIKRWNNWSAGGEFRFWTRSNAKGHFIGLHGNYIDYNFLLNKTGHEGKAYGGGIVYGFLVKVRERLDFEFEIGAGCFYAEGNKFVYTKDPNCPARPIPALTERYKKYYIGPTKINISLIHRF